MTKPLNNTQILPTLSRRRRIDRRSILLMVFAFALMSSFTFTGLQNLTKTEAVSAKDFNAGKIISDYNMSRYDSMTEAEIQKFLESKNKCNNTNVEEAKKYPKVTYHIKDGRYVCMFEEKFDTTTGMPATTDSKTTETAAHIIYSAAQQYKINPQVLIVLLEKEQSLITDTWPNNIQYRAATGYGCPDTAACDSKYYGLHNQVFNAAKLFRTVLDGGWTNYPLGENYVQYNPNKECGGTKVNIQNLATSALYRYTPYQPNAAALAAGFGAGDSCSAYGNRNFYLLFANWFYDPLDDSTAEVKAAASETAKEKTETKSADTTTTSTEKTTEQASSNTKTNTSTTSDKTTNAEQPTKSDTSTTTNTSQSKTQTTTENQNTKETTNKDKSGKQYKTINAINDFWKKNGAEKGGFGYPTENYGYDSKTDMYWQGFQNGYIVGSDKTGWHESMGAIRTYWAKSGYQSSKFGLPVDGIGYDSKTDMYWQEYQNGFIVGSGETGWHESSGEIREFWLNNGAQGGFYGLPVDGIGYDSKTGMYWQEYQNGFIVGTDKTGYYGSAGAIRAYWGANGYQNGKFGLPLSDVLYDSKTMLYSQKYQKATIYYDARNNKPYSK